MSKSDKVVQKPRQSAAKPAAKPVANKASGKHSGKHNGAGIGNGAGNGVGSCRTVHVALPLKTLKHLQRLAKADQRSINFKARELLEAAVYGQMGRSSRAEYEHEQQKKVVKV